MITGSWSPTADTADFHIDPTVLERFIELSRNEQLENLTQVLDDSDIQAWQPLMRQPKNAWFAAAEPLSNEQLVHLVRFFTRAEMQLSGWEAGADSPVVWLVKVLRQRKAPPDKELLLWIKQHSDNRFLPNGAL